MGGGLRERIQAVSGRLQPNGHLILGYAVLHGQLRFDQPLLLPHERRPEHVAVLGKTGTGKSSLLRFLCEQDVRAGRGFIFFDLHGDATPALVRLIAQEESRRGEDLSKRLIVFDPADRQFSVGINILEAEDEQQRYVQLAEITQILKDRWKLEAFGPRTEELLRNSLQVLIDNQLTFVELGPLLTDDLFRATCLEQTTHPEARTYFTTRYGRLSQAARAEYREAVLNKITVFTEDPHFRHLLGQTRSTFSLTDVAEGGYWLIFNLDRGRLGEQATTLGSLLLSRLKHVLFASRSRTLLTLYCDELQNLVALDGGLDTLLAESRKLGIAVTTANQYLDQYPLPMQSAILSVGTVLFFQLSGIDATRIAGALGGRREVAHRLRTLPPRQMVGRVLGGPVMHAGVPDLSEPEVDGDDLLRRTQALWGERRSRIEEEIRARTGAGMSIDDRLDGWE